MLSIKIGRFPPFIVATACFFNAFSAEPEVGESLIEASLHAGNRMAIVHSQASSHSAPKTARRTEDRVDYYISYGFGFERSTFLGTYPCRQEVAMALSEMEILVGLVSEGGAKKIVIHSLELEDLHLKGTANIELGKPTAARGLQLKPFQGRLFFALEAAERTGVEPMHFSLSLGELTKAPQVVVPNLLEYEPTEDLASHSSVAGNTILEMTGELSELFLSVNDGSEHVSDLFVESVGNEAFEIESFSYIPHPRYPRLVRRRFRLDRERTEALGLPSVTLYRNLLGRYLIEPKFDRIGNLSSGSRIATLPNSWADGIEEPHHRITELRKGGLIPLLLETRLDGSKVLTQNRFDCGLLIASYSIDGSLRWGDNVETFAPEMQVSNSPPKNP